MLDIKSWMSKFRNKKNTVVSDNIKDILMIGNKPYKHASLSALLDSFDATVYRYNMSLPNKNNGTKCDVLYLCNHLYENIIDIPFNIDYMLSVYGTDYIDEYIREFVNKFDKNDYSEIVKVLPRTDVYNEFLTRIKAPKKIRFTKRPRAGYISLFESLIKYYEEIVSNKLTIFVFGFSIMDEHRKSYYVKDDISKLEGRDIHSRIDEINIICWLHKSGLIDATLCMIKDDEKIMIDKTIRTMKPTKTIKRLL